MISFIEGLFIFIFTLLIYFIIVFQLNKRGILEKYKISLYGPALLLRTKKGVEFLKKIASKKRFWKSYGTASILICFIAMIIITTVLIWQTWTIIGFTPEQKEVLPGPEFALIIPGINPILPLDYLPHIIIALAVAIIIHEFSHGILTFAGNLKVKSLGILYLILPIGAFCEPDEEKLKKTNILTRMRVYAAGPIANFIAAFVCLILFSFVFMSAVSPVSGVEVLSVGEDTPAENLGLTSGTTLLTLNDTNMTNVLDFLYVLQNTSSNQLINISYYKEGKTYSTTVELADKYNYTNNESHKGFGYLGVGPNLYGGYITTLKNPFLYFPDGFVLVYALPIFGYFNGYNPIVSPFTDSLVIEGPLSFIPPVIFWQAVNLLYWIFWLNLAVGLFNVLPMIPLDGGFLFNDAISGSIKKLKSGISKEQHDKAVKNISLVISLSILFLIISPWIIRYF